MNLPERIQHIQIDAFAKNAGNIEQPGPFIFQYSADNPVSLTMQVKDTPYNRGALHPVFAQNLPEGYVRRYLHEKLLRHAQVNDLYLLALQGDKAIGHLTYRSDFLAPQTDQIDLNDIISWSGKDSLFPQLLDRYYLSGILSGVQPKVMVPVTEKSAITQERVIVKTFDEEFDQLTVNEFVCMSAARHVGLKPPRFWLSDDQQCFIIERFDTRNGEPLAFEDFTVLMGKNGDYKYQSSYEQLLKAIKLYTKSQAQIELAYRYIVFNCLIGNGDAHLKNFALQYDKNRTTIELTPPYDITNTLVYPTLDNNLALKIRGSKLFPNKAELIKLGQDHDIKKPQEIIENTAEGILEYLATSNEVALMKGLRQAITQAVDTGLSGNAIAKPYIHQKKRKHE